MAFNKVGVALSAMPSA
ncbi:hypothetical protein YPPY66_1102, partial [Yersinia pestis PY-66]